MFSSFQNLLWSGSVTEKRSLGAFYPINIDLQSVPYHIRLSPIFNAKKHTYYSKNLAFSAKNCYQPYQIFQNDSFFLNFLICPPNRNLDPLTWSNLMWDTLYMYIYIYVYIYMLTSRPNWLNFLLYGTYMQDKNSKEMFVIF